MDRRPDQGRTQDQGRTKDQAPGTKDYHSRRGTRWTPRFARSIDSGSALVAENGSRSGMAGQWLRAQLDGGPPSLAPPDGVTATAIGEALRAIRMGGQGNDQERRQARRRVVEMSHGGNARRAHRTRDQRAAVRRAARRVLVQPPVRLDRLEDLVAPLAGSYERDVIRAHVLGRFEDMVLASAKHPAMLVYLDNFQSIGPTSRGAGAGQRGNGNGQRRGLNENYARELLELHTLGVNGGYTQQDVQELAKILTGWTDQRTRRARRAAAAGAINRGGEVAQTGGSAAAEADGPIEFAFHRSAARARQQDGVAGSATARPASRKASGRSARCAGIHRPRSSSPPSW